MATRTNTPAPAVETAPSEASAAPVERADTGLFNMPRMVAKPVKVIETAPKPTIYAAGERLTLSGVVNADSVIVEKAKPAFKSIEDALK